MKKSLKIKALCDENRLRILALLISGEMCVCDLMVILDLPQSTVSRRLAYLRNERPLPLHPQLLPLGISVALPASTDLEIDTCASAC